MLENSRVVRPASKPHANSSDARSVRAWYWLLAALFFAVNCRWIWLYRHGQVLDIDEAGYLGISVVDYYHLIHGGIADWFAAVNAPSIQAPLTTALSSLLFGIFGLHLIVAFAVPLVAGTGCVLAAYLLGTAVCTPRNALFSAVLTASCPVILNYSRSFQFSMPATLFATLAVAALLHSRRFRSLTWATAFGFFLGLMPLARTMTVAFIPGIVAGALIFTLSDPVDRMRRTLVLGGALIFALLTASVWFYSNGALVAHYLLNYGYGAHATEYGPKTSIFGLEAWLVTAQYIGSEIYLPHFLILLLGSFATMAVGLKKLAQHHGYWVSIRQALRSPALPLVVFCCEGVVALTSSSNKGSGFFAPIAPAALVLSIWAFSRIDEVWFSRRWATYLVMSISLVAAIPFLDLRPPLASPTKVTLPLLGSITVTNGRGTIQSYEAAGSYGAVSSVQPVSVGRSHAWIHLSIETADILSKMCSQNRGILFGFRNRMYNVNTVDLQNLVRSGLALTMYQVDPITTGVSVAGYLKWIENHRAACALVTSNRVAGDFPPVINPRMMDEAARRGGYAPVRVLQAPDDRVITIWRPHAVQ